ncbi:unnamed protein product [Rotaria sordida]|uniref:Uncharacterized protein n=1 Tax=Rotaria sordida TaxID=392033 RepID=A0A814WVS1_9BILA|nr:unnamed protein product [Rotaria sordida]CAF1273553.1 unnamed protein product [Rotaria sordida]CAF3699422.1 unnamed protein product [Rotaria sordida]
MACFMAYVAWLVLAFMSSEGLAGTNLQHIKELLETIRHAANAWETLKNLPPTLAENFLSVTSKDGAKKEQRSSYDFIVDLTRPTDIYDALKAYPLLFPLGKQSYDNKTKDSFSRFVINVVGRYNVGKTYVLRLLANINLGDAFIERTNGISVSLPLLQETNNVPMALIDTAGSRTPVEYSSKTFHRLSYEKQLSDSFVQEIAFNSAEIFILVVNQLTLDDELYLKTLHKRLQEKSYRDDEIKQRLLIVHNYFNLKTIKEVEKVETTELKNIFNAVKQPQGYWLSEYFKHFVLADSNSKAGKHYNQRSIAEIITMIRGSPAAKENDLLTRIIKEIEKLLSKFLIEQSPSISKQQEPNEEATVGYVAAKIELDHNKQHRIRLSDKSQINVDLEIKELIWDKLQPWYFICSREPLGNNVILSKNLKFNEDGSIYIDYSSQFIPDIQVAIMNQDGDVGIITECPSCSPNFTVRALKATIIVQGEKIPDATLKDYVNTRRTGKFEVQIPIGKLDEDKVYDFRSLKKEFSNGVIKITLSTLRDEF